MSLFSAPVNDYGLANQLCNIINGTEFPDPLATGVSVLNIYDGSVSLARTIPRVPPFPTIWIWQTPVAQYICIEPTRHADEAIALMLGYNAPPAPYPGGDLNPYLLGFCTYAQAYLLGIISGGPPKLLFLGHSLGGACAIALAGLNWQLGGYQQKIVTFGSPRPGGAALSRALKAIPLCRWMNAGDPVPTLPPRPEGAPLYWLSQGQQAATNSCLYVQPDGGIVLNTGSDPTIAPTPPLTGNFSEYDLASWLLQTDEGGTSAHAMESYTSNLAALLAKYPTVALHPESDAENPVSASVRSRSIETLAEVMVQTIAKTRPTGGPQSVEITPSLAPRTLRNSKIFPVILNGVVIAYAESRSGARSLVKNLRKVLKGLGAAVEVDVDGLTTNLTTVLTDMSENPYPGSIRLNAVVPTP